MLFLSYLKKIRMQLISVPVCALILTAITLLSDLPAAELLYGGILCLVFLLILAIVDFVRFYRRHVLMKKIAEGLPLSLEHLPKPCDLAEEDDIQLIESLHREITALSDRFTAERREREDYYTVWAHQIKTPIAAMRLLMQSGEIACPEAEGELFEIEQYVEMALGYLRMESEFTDYRIRQCDLDGILRSVIHAYAGQFIRKKLSLDFRPTSLTVLTDEKWLSFVIGQILQNSLKYTRQGGITIRSEGRSLIIEDTGIGIAPDDLPRIGQKGFTGHNGRLEQKSTGLGLYLCRTILGRLSHTLEITSTVGVGTKVVIGLDRTHLQVE
ncbi:MAG: sensor histidine kinase [Eubacteriales bacterium]